MRFLCAFRIKDAEDNLILKTEVHTTKVNDIEKGRVQLLVKLATDYDIPTTFVERGDEIPGILYINPKKEYEPANLDGSELEEWEERYFDAYE